MNSGEVFRLTKEVKNPKPDRRSNTVWALEVWPAGSLWRVVPAHEHTVEVLYMLGHHGRIPANDTAQYNALRPHLEPVGMLRSATGVNVESRNTLRAFFMLAESDPKAILTYLWYKGRVTLEELEAINDILQGTEESDYEKFYW